MYGATLYTWQTPKEEVANCITHGLGLAASVVGTALLVTISTMNSEVRV